MSVKLAKLEVCTCNLSRILADRFSTRCPSDLFSIKTTHRHLRVIRVLICSNANGTLHTPLNITLICVRLHQFQPGLGGVARSIKAALIGFLCLFLVVQTQAQITKYLPFQSGLPVRNVLSFEMSNLSTKYSPHAKVLQVSDQRINRSKHTSYLVKDHKKIIKPSFA